MLISGFIAPHLNINGGLISVLDNTTFQVAPVQARDLTNSNDILISVPVNVSFNAIGLNGLDTGAIDIKKVYYVYAISSSSGRGAPGYIVSLNPVRPYTPIYYDVYQRIGVVVTDASSHLYPMLEVGRGGEKHYQYYSAQTILANGSATSWTSVDLSSFVPLFATRVYFSYGFTPTDAINVAALTATGSVNSPLIYLKGSVATVAINGGCDILCNLASISGIIKPAINYQVTAGTDVLTLSIIGFDDYV